MEIKNDMMIVLQYTLKDDNKEGDVIEQTTPEAPLKFIFGKGMMLPAFEANLAGKSAGETFEMRLESKDAYGEVNKEAVVDLPKDIFMVEGEFDTDRFQLGAQIPMMTAEGRRMMGLILEVSEDTIKMDFNHQLAGVDLYFEGSITEVREATEEEVSQLLGGGGCGSDCGCDDQGSDCSSGSCGSGGGCGC